MKYFRSGSICRTYIFPQQTILKITKETVKIQLVDDILEDFLEVNRIISKHILTPKLHRFGHLVRESEARIFLLESYVGRDVRSIVNSTSDFKTINNVVTLVVETIRKLPQDVAIDTNPANFALSNNNVYFLDFLPPKPLKYRSSQYSTTYSKIFPTISTDFDYKNKFSSYYLTKFRIARFYKYLINTKGKTVNERGQVIPTSTSEPL